MRGPILIGLAVVGILLLNTGLRIHMISLGYEIEALLGLLHDVRRSHKELLVERETLSALDRIEQIAQKRFRMITPLPHQVIFLEWPEGGLESNPEVEDATERMASRK